MVGYGMMSLQELGFDTTITLDRSQMSGCPDAFTIDKIAIFWRKSIASRGTTRFDVTKVRDAEPFYVWKEAWRGVGHNSEVELLLKAKAAGVNGLTEYLAFEDVHIDGAVDDIRGNIMKGLVVGSPTQLVFPNSVGVESPAFLSTFVAAVGGIPTQGSPVERPGGPEVKSQRSHNTANLRTPRTVHAFRTFRTLRTHCYFCASSSMHSKGYRPAYRTRSHAAPAPKKRKLSTLLVSSRRKAAQMDIPPPEFNRTHSRILMRKGREIYRCKSSSSGSTMPSKATARYSPREFYTVISRSSTSCSRYTRPPALMANGASSST